MQTKLSAIPVIAMRKFVQWVNMWLIACNFTDNMNNLGLK